VIPHLPPPPVDEPTEPQRYDVYEGRYGGLLRSFKGTLLIIERDEFRVKCRWLGQAPAEVDRLLKFARVA
jgi:hypothetical protein